MTRKIGPNVQRRADIKAALQAAGPDDRIPLTDLATVFGVAKTRFVNIKQQMISEGFDFPPPESGDKGAHIYHARRALKAMLDWEQRNDARAEQQRKTVSAILGQRPAEDGSATLPISELAMLNREAARAHERMREQGQLTSLADQAATAAKIWSRISQFFGDLPARVDPNGQLPAEVRTKIAIAGVQAQKALYEEMRALLRDDPVPRNQKRRRTSGRAD